MNFSKLYLEELERGLGIMGPTISDAAAMFSLPWMTAPMLFPVASPSDAKKSRFSGVARAKREAKKRRNRRG